MTPRAVGRVLLVGVAIGLLALLAAASDVAAVWAVPIGVAVSILGEPPVIRRAVGTVVAALATVGMLGPASGLAGSLEVGAALSVAVLVVVAGVLRLRGEAPAPAWTVLLGGATVLAGAQVAGGAHLADVAPAVGGLVLGLLPMQVGEVVVALRHEPEPDSATVVVEDRP